MLHRAFLVALFVAVPIFGVGQPAPTASSVEGIWKIAESVTTGANATTIASPQPSLLIFGRGHYSWVSLSGTAPRAAVADAKDPAKLTDAEKIARFEQWNPLTAQAGTYEIKGTMMTRRPIVAKNVSVMTGPAIVSEVRLEGSTLWLTTKSTAGAPASETRVKLTRVQ